MDTLPYRWDERQMTGVPSTRVPKPEGLYLYNYHSDDRKMFVPVSSM